MISDLTDDGDKRFALGFLDTIMTWNQIEDQARNILLAASGGGVGAFAAVLSLGNVALSNAIRSQAEYMEPIWREHLQHFVEVMDRQRAYRNYYVHNVFALGRSQDGKVATAMLTSTEAKPLLRHHQGFLSDGRVQEFASELEQLRLYGFHLWQMLRRKYKDGPKVPEVEPQSWPQKPHVPETLKRLRTYLPGHAPPPQS